MDDESRHDSVQEDEAGDPENAGKSTTRRGEDVVDDEGQEAGRHDTGTQGASARPTGESSARDATGVDPQEPIDAESPNLRPA